MMSRAQKLKAAEEVQLSHLSLFQSTSTLKQTKFVDSCKNFLVYKQSNKREEDKIRLSLQREQEEVASCDEIEAKL